MRLSARNQVAGTIKKIEKGAVTSQIQIEVAAGVVITAAITNEAVAELGLEVGSKATAVIKASNVMVAV
ncbi:transporter [Acetobacteraceae bacterium]|nr:transporter [Acetobacteraceae bacterium]